MKVTSNGLVRRRQGKKLSTNRKSREKGMELNTNTTSESFVIQIMGLSAHGWNQLCRYGFDLMPLYWAPTGHGVTLSHLVLAPDMRLEFQPVGHHTVEDGRRFVVTRLYTIAEILRKIELNGVPTRFDWVKEKLPDAAADQYLGKLISKMRDGAA